MGRVYIGKVDVCIVVGSHSGGHISPVRCSACVAAEAGHRCMIVSCVGHEEVVEYNVNRGAAIHDSKVATRCGLQSMSEHVAVVLARFAFGGALGTHF
jgi:hypothetical protein